MARESGAVVAKVGLDDSGFQQGISRIQRSLKVVQSDFAAASSKLGDFGKSTDGLKLKADSLNKQMQIQREKVAALSKAYQESAEKKGLDAKATENLKIQLNNASAELNKIEQELKATTRELNLKTSAWYKLSQSMEAASAKMKAAGVRIAAIGRSLTTAVTLPIIGVGAAVTKMAMDAVESENLFEVSMGSMAKQARKWSDDTSKALGLNAYSVRKSMATYNAMITSMGLTKEESLKMSEGLTQLSYDMASFYNLNPEEAFEKLKSGISGEAEPLKALGILVNDTTIKTYAYANGIAKEGEALSETQKVQARYGAIMQATTKAQGDLSRTMDSPTNKLRIMKEQAAQIGIQFGQILIPVLERLMAVIKPLMDKFQGLSKEQQDMIVKIALIAAAAGPVILIIGKIVTIAGSLASVIGTVSGAIAAAGGASGALGAALAVITGPVGLVIAAIAGVVAAFVLLFQNNEEFREKVIKVWGEIKNVLGGIFDAISELIKAFVLLGKDIWEKYGKDITAIFSATFDTIAAIVMTVLNVIKDIIEIITNVIKGDWEAVFRGLGKLTEDVWNGIASIIENAIKLIISIVTFELDVIKDIFPNAWGKIKDATSNIWAGIKRAIVDPIGTAKSAVKSAIDAIVGFFKNLKFPEIKIPKVKLPHFKLEGKFSLSPPQVPRLSVDWYASGGIFNSPSVIGVGERGSEAVLPIDRLDEIIANALIKAGVMNQMNTAGNSNGARAVNEYHITINNPKMEEASKSMQKLMLRQSYGLL